MKECGECPYLYLAYNASVYRSLGLWSPVLKAEYNNALERCCTEDDLSQLSGKTEELTGLLQQRCGYGKVQIDNAGDNPALSDIIETQYLHDYSLAPGCRTQQ